MPRLYKFLSIFRSNDRMQFNILFTSFILFVFWHVGYFEFLREIDFKDFRWPAYVNVRHQVVLELTGRPAEYLHYNEWTNFQTLAQPTCKKNWLTRKKSILLIIKSAPDRLEVGYFPFLS
jgi:hypothetical protein